MRIWHGVNENPSFIPMCFGTQQKVGSGKKFLLHYFHLVIITYKSIKIVFSIEYQHTSSVEQC